MRFTFPSTVLFQLLAAKPPTQLTAFSFRSNPLLSKTHSLPKIQQRTPFSSLPQPHQNNNGGLFITLDSQANNSQPDSTICYTSADITETIRFESEMEMTKVDYLLNSLSAMSTTTEATTTEATTRIPTLLKTKEQLSTYLTNTHNIQNYLFDCDGVLYRGTDPMPEASQTIQSLINAGKKVFFVTNNAGSCRMELKCKLEKVLKCPDGMLKEEMMIGSAYVAAKYLQSRLVVNNGEDGEIGKEEIETTNAQQQKIKPRIHVIGTAGLCQEIQSAGFDISGGPDPGETPSGMSRDELASYPFSELNNAKLEDGGIDAVVVGLDNDFNYRKLCIATVLLQHNPHALLVATNLDAFDLVGFDARHLPGNGALVRAVEMASGRTAINVGKPSKVLAQLILETNGLNAQETIMIGDRLDTDVKFGNDGGMMSGLVLTGCATAKDIVKAIQREEDQDMVPLMIFPHVGLMAV